jgi:hypothetical protein
MKHFLLSWAWTLAGMSAAEIGARDIVWTETRFHRIHLHNGNVVDGQLVEEDARSVTLSLPVGRMLIRRDQIDRVEQVMMRTVTDKPRILGTMGELAALSDVRGLLSDPEPTVRAAAVTSLALSGERNSLEDVAPLLTDADSAVRSRAAAALNSCPYPTRIGTSSFPGFQCPA